MQLKNLRTFSQLREAPSPRFGSSGDFDWTEAKKMQFAIFRNISDVYTKVASTDSVTNCNWLELFCQVRQNRKDIDKKCPKVKCEKMLKKVKKVKTSVDFIQQTNLTELENLVTVLQDSPAGNFWKNVWELWVNLKPLSGNVNVSINGHI